jgi:hypothetical protein
MYFANPKSPAISDSSVANSAVRVLGSEAEAEMHAYGL